MSNIYIIGGIDLNQAFFNLDQDKQKRILDAAMQEFAENGYNKASTNQIVKQAEIGKGMLFYYFKNKKELYLYLVDYCLNVTAKEFLEKIDTNERDFIERYKSMARIKMEYHLQHPHVLHFLGNIFIQEEVEIPEKFQKRYEEIMKMSHHILYENIDKSLFREDIDTEKAFNLIRWTIEGYQNDLIRQFKNIHLASTDFDPYWDEFYEYLDVLKTVYYKS